MRHLAQLQLNVNASGCSPLDLNAIIFGLNMKMILRSHCDIFFLFFICTDHLALCHFVQLRGNLMRQNIERFKRAFVTLYAQVHNRSATPSTAALLTPEA